MPFNKATDDDVMDYSGARLFSAKPKLGDMTLTALQSQRNELRQALKALNLEITNQGIANTMAAERQHDPADLHYMKRLQEINRAQKEVLLEKIAAINVEIELREKTTANTELKL